MTHKAKPAGTHRERSFALSAVVLELENFVFTGRHVAFNALKQVLEDKGMTLTPVAFSRYCLDVPPETYLDTLPRELGKTRLSKEILLAEFQEAYRQALKGSRVKPNPAAVKLLKSCTGRGVRLGILSGVDPETAAVLMQKVGETVDHATLLATATGDAELGAQDAWLKLVRKMDVPPGRCLAIASGSRCCTAAISVGMRCAACPDPYTGFQDFSGADLILDTLDDSAIDGIVSLLGRP